MQIQDASALVTGASRGIGRDVARRLAAVGARVTVLARSEPDLTALVEEIRREGGRALAFAGDIREPGVCERAVAAADEAHGRLQILVNNAGVGIHAPLGTMSDADWETVIGTNLTGAFRMTRAALPQLTRGGGHVFMISSLAGRNAIAGLGAYCASKAALDHLAACLMLEVRHEGVKVTTLAPGSVETGFAGGSAPTAADLERTWKLTGEDVAETILGLLATREGAHLSRVEMRPLRPPKR